jgi:hypothetical protein
MKGSSNPLEDLFSVGRLVSRALVGELTDSDVRKADTEPAPPPCETDGPGADCPRCAGEKEVLFRGVVVPCPVCVSYERVR